MKIKSILGKSIAVAALSVTGLVAVNTMNSNDAQAAIVQNDATVYTVHTTTTVYNDYENPVATGQTLPSNTDWRIIKTAYDSKGQKWYDLGKNQWVKATSAASSVVKTEAPKAETQQPQQAQTQTYSAPQQSSASTTSSSSYTSTATGSEASAKAWIANRESSGSYSARNGQYIGKYQLSASYLNGDYSAANQERVADNYVKSRYGSWTAAQSFWQANGWY
ncbi:hypothetical protein [Lactobacillus intestinalis]|uniref:aggregation-promoting factor n=1 Tax=Lactobacillus intestinalis TaxID=151781 RepID=UPI0026652360|nr:hypothetical protein [Lactobacillus intestinalis]